MYSEKIRGCVVSCLIEGSETWENEKKDWMNLHYFKLIRLKVQIVYLVNLN